MIVRLQLQDFQRLGFSNITKYDQLISDINRITISMRVRKDNQIITESRIYDRFNVSEINVSCKNLV
jgi:hypothetical protein